MISSVLSFKHNLEDKVWKPTANTERAPLGLEFSVPSLTLSCFNWLLFLSFVDVYSTSRSPQPPTQPGPSLRTCHFMLWNIWGHQMWLLQTLMCPPQIPRALPYCKSHASIWILDFMSLEFFHHQKPASIFFSFTPLSVIWALPASLSPSLFLTHRHTHNTQKQL